MSNTSPTAAAKRLKNITEYEILSLNPDVGFDNIAYLAAEIFEVDNASISFIGSDVLTIARIGDLTVSDKLLHSSIADLETEEAFLLNDGHEFELSFFIAVPIKTGSNEVIGTISVYADKSVFITDNKLNMLKRLPLLITEKLETRLAIRNTMRAQDDRLHVLIHDLKNPMTTVSLQSELVSRMPNIDEKAALIAGKINLQSKKIVDHLNDILSSARRKNGSFKPQKEKIDLSIILGDAIEQLGYECKKKNIQIQRDIKENLEIFGDKEKLNVVFYHLLQNAIKFSQPSSKIKISHQLGENQIIIAITDNGVGLSAEDLEDLFVKFADLSSKPTSGEYSNGLGLTLAKMYLDVHKGKLWAESAGKNQGTTFFIALPIK